MRIIAGQFRGRRLVAPQSDVTRPITDRVKQSLFDIVAPLLAEAVVYDCFAGTGSMGLESLSRGATRAVFFESNRSALELLGQNVAALGVEAACTIIRADLFKFFRGQPSLPKSDVVFFDPPYAYLQQRGSDLRQLAADLAARMNPGATFVFRHDASDVLELPGLEVRDTRDYGGMRIELLSAGGLSSRA